MSNIALKNQVLEYMKNPSNLATLDQGIKEKITAACDRFNLAPDVLVDIKRLPISVQTLDNLFDYLETIQERLANRNPSVKTEDWDVAKSGQLRQYKLYVCAIHALSGFLNDKSATCDDSTKLPEAIMDHARTHPVGGLSTHGKTMWGKTFEDGQHRTLMVISSLLYFCSKEKPSAGLTA